MVDFIDVGEKVLLGFVGSPVESHCFFLPTAALLRHCGNSSNVLKSRGELAKAEIGIFKFLDRASVFLSSLSAYR
jgi:hypothetical protein